MRLSLRRAAIGLYRALTYACPPEFRRRYGEEMVRDVSDRLNGNGASASIVAISAAECGDLITRAAIEWAHDDAARVSGLAVVGFAALWSGAMLVAAWQWPNGPDAPVVHAATSAAALAGLLAVVALQRRSRGPCSLPLQGQLDQRRG